MIQVHDLHFIPLLSQEVIQARIATIGAELSQRYEGKNPLFISVLNGSFIFTADLMRTFRGESEVCFVKISSYSGTQSTGKVKMVSGLEKSELENRHLIVVEDIVDTGRTLHAFLDFLQKQDPASICTVTCLRKPDAIEVPVQVDYVCFDIENRFVVGYGLDYNGQGRNIPGIYVLKPDGAAIE